MTSILISPDSKEDKKNILNNINKNNDLYWMHGWAENYFRINEKGDINIHPSRDDNSINLHELVTSLVQRGIEPPLLFRFDGIIRDRIECIYSAFHSAIKEYQYRNEYHLAYPIKVNQQKHVVDTIKKAGSKHRLGLEVGSKPELLAVLSIYDTEKALLLCNGYKDAEYIELALLSIKIGRRPIIIIEQLNEIALVLQMSEKLGIEAEIGLRIKPHSKGSGKWSSSGGELAKFGLNIHEINLAIQQLKDAGKEKWLKLLHFHIGSQVTSIIPMKKAIREAARVYAQIAKQCPSMSFLDVGGGLAVDYDGSKTTCDCSMNYTIEQYARDVVYIIGSICKEENLNDPIIISESGRAIVAHHSILVTEVMDVSPSLNVINRLSPPPTKNKILQELFDIYQHMTAKNCLESLHDASDLKENAIEKFIQGDLSLEERAYIERNYCHLKAKVNMLASELEFVPKEIEDLKSKLLDIYFCNCSVFQSLPDSWAIQQLFPVMPIHRLDTKPNRQAIIVDLTCDSDGKINKFVSPKKTSNFIPLHEPNSSPYYLGIFLVGAYQETLGGLHNLFGDTNAVHVDKDDQGNWELKHQIEGDTIKEVLSYVQYNIDDLIERLRISIEKALRNNHLTLAESAKLKHRFKQALQSYTYLVV
jgi:arginine decarboxylase